MTQRFVVDQKPSTVLSRSGRVLGNGQQWGNRAADQLGVSALLERFEQRDPNQSISCRAFYPASGAGGERLVALAGGPRDSRHRIIRRTHAAGPS